MSVLSWFEHQLGISPNKPAAVNFAQVVADIETAVSAAIDGVQAAEAAKLIDDATAAKIGTVIPAIQSGLTVLAASHLPSDASALLADLQLVVPLLPAADQVAVSTAIAVSNVALAAFLHPAAAPATPSA